MVEGAAPLSALSVPSAAVVVLGQMSRAQLKTGACSIEGGGSGIATAEGVVPEVDIRNPSVAGEEEEAVVHHIHPSAAAAAVREEAVGVPGAGNNRGYTAFAWPLTERRLRASCRLRTRPRGYQNPYLGRDAAAAGHTPKVVVEGPREYREEASHDC